MGAFENGELVGLIALGREDKKNLEHKAMIWGMYVSPKARGKGIGKALLREALSLAQSVPGIQQVNLCVNADNAVALGLYESVGFKAFGREPGAMLINGELHDEIHMYMRLANG
ncbi:MAG: family N-acetyltransferase [Rhodocyclales bacterium]|nr:family N-acetyltransferase [Rhodocyclales bacterium]